MASLASMLRGTSVKEGTCPKMASSKGKDEIRGKWDDRFFQLKGYQLFYYKKQGDNKPKGEIDLRDAKIDAADDFKTGRPNCIRVAQAKQVFTYFQARTTKDRDEWILALRIAAGYDNPQDEIDPQKNKEINEQMDSYCSFGVLLVDAKNAEHPDRVVLTLDPSGTIRIIKDDEVKKTYEVSQLDKIECSEKTELRLVDSFGIHELWSMTLDFRDAGSAARHKFYVGSMDETKDLVQLMRQFKTKNFGVVKSICQTSTYKSLQIEVGDYTQTGKWESRWAVLREKKVILFKTNLSRKAMWALYVQPANIKKDGKVGISIRTGIETALLKFDTEKDRNEWYKDLEAVAQTLKDKIEKEVKSEREERKKIERTPVPTTPAPLDDVAVSFPIAAEFSKGDSSFIASWGDGTSGQLGSREKNSLLDPYLVEALARKNVRSISAGDAHSGAVTESGHLYMWGAGTEMQLGLGERMTESKSPYLVTSLIKNYVIMNVSCGAHHTLAVTSKGIIFAWGSNSKGQLGLGNAKNAAYPTEIPKLQGQPVTYISAGTEHSACIVGDQGELFTWGGNGSGCLGIGSTKPATEPQSNILGKKGKVTMVECGTDFTAAIVSGKLYTWGTNEFGQLGQADKEPRQVPTQVQYFKDQDVKVVQVACGGTHTIALCSKNKKTSLYAWGASVVNGFREPQTLPTRITAIENVKYIACSPSHTVVINDECQLFSFGVNRHGELGNGQAGVQATVKVRLVESCRVVKAVCGNGFTIALCSGEPPEDGITPTPTAAYVRNQASVRETGQIRDALGIQQSKDKRNLLNIEDTNETIARLLAVEHSRNNGKFRDDPNDAGQPLKDRHVEAITTLMDLEKVGGFSNDSSKPQVPSYALGSVQGTATKFRYDPAMEKHATGSDARLKNILADLSRKENKHDDGGDDVALPPPPDEEETEPTRPPSISSSKTPKITIASAGSASPALSPLSLKTAPTDGAKKKKPPLPAGWKKVKDPNSGHSYYYHTKTKKTQWKRPTEETDPEA